MNVQPVVQPLLTQSPLQVLLQRNRPCFTRKVRYGQSALPRYHVRFMASGSPSGTRGISPIPTEVKTRFQGDQALLQQATEVIIHHLNTLRREPQW